jgi:hypothetical protein
MGTPPHSPLQSSLLLQRVFLGIKNNKPGTHAGTRLFITYFNGKGKRDRHFYRLHPTGETGGTA